MPEKELKNEQEFSDAEMMANPDTWPNWPCLPVKRRKPDGGMPDTGTMLDMPGPLKHAVFLTSIWEVADGEADFDTCEKQAYDSLEALLADGWIVD